MSDDFYSLTPKTGNSKPKTAAKKSSKKNITDKKPHIKKSCSIGVMMTDIR